VFGLLPLERVGTRERKSDSGWKICSLITHVVRRLSEEVEGLLFRVRVSHRNKKAIR
jgi:hypothetical protein